MSTASSSPVVTPAYARPKTRRGPSGSWSGLTLGVAAPLLALLGAAWWFGWLSPAATATGGESLFVVQPVDLHITLTEDGELKAQKSVEYRSEVEGQATLLFLVPESTRVKKGDLLVELSADELKERLENEQIQLQTTRAAYEAAVQTLEITRNENASKLKKADIDQQVAELDLRQYLEGEFPQKTREKEIEIAQAKMDIERKTDELEKNQRLFEKEFVTRSKIDQLKFELDKAVMTLEKAKLASDTLRDYEHPKVLKQKQSTLDQAREEFEREKKRSESRETQELARVEEQKANLAMRERRVLRISEQLTKTKIHATVDGVVRYSSGGDNWRWSDPPTVGQKVNEGQTLCVIPVVDHLIVTTRIHEADRHYIKEGLPVQVRVPAVPGQSFEGTIEKVAQFADSANSWLNPNLKEHAAEIRLTSTDAPLSPGDSAEIKVLVDTLPGVLAVPVQAVFARGPKAYVFAQRDGRPAVVEVKLGRASDRLIAIEAGLQAGDRVYLSASEPMLAMLPSAPERDVAGVTGPGGEKPAGRGGRGRGGPSAKAAQPAVTSASQPAVTAAAEAAKPEASTAKPAEAGTAQTTTPPSGS